MAVGMGILIGGTTTLDGQVGVMRLILTQIFQSG